MYTPATLKLPHSLVISPPQLLRADNNLCYQTVHYNHTPVFRGTHMSPANLKQSVTNRQTNRRRTKCRSICGALLAPQK